MEWLGEKTQKCAKYTQASANGREIERRGVYGIKQETTVPNKTEAYLFCQTQWLLVCFPLNPLLGFLQAQ